MKRLLVLAAIVLAACATKELSIADLSERTAEQHLLAALKDYADGDYAVAALRFHQALAAGLTYDRDRVIAYKHLAFIDCATDKIAACRDEFRHALKIDPNLDLSEAEAGHPVWGPVFAGVKAEKDARQ